MPQAAITDLVSQNISIVWNLKDKEDVMPRRRRGWIDNACYHITHRCHNRDFLFHFKKYRRFYLRHLFEMRKRYKIDVWDYMGTSNHVHLLLTAKKGESIKEKTAYATRQEALAET